MNKPRVILYRGRPPVAPPTRVQFFPKWRLKIKYEGTWSNIRYIPYVNFSDVYHTYKFINENTNFTATIQERDKIDDPWCDYEVTSK